MFIICVRVPDIQLFRPTNTWTKTINLVIWLAGLYVWISCENEPNTTKTHIFLSHYGIHTTPKDRHGTATASNTWYITSVTSCWLTPGERSTWSLLLTIKSSKWPPTHSDLSKHMIAARDFELRWSLFDIQNLYFAVFYISRPSRHSNSRRDGTDNQ